MTSCVLHKSSFVAKSVIAVFSHAVEVRLVLPVVAARKATILVEPRIIQSVFDALQNEEPEKNCSHSLTNPDPQTNVT